MSENKVLKVLDETEHYALEVGYDYEGFPVYHLRNKEHDVVEVRNPQLHVIRPWLPEIERITYAMQTIEGDDIVDADILVDSSEVEKTKTVH